MSMQEYLTSMNYLTIHCNGVVCDQQSSLIIRLKMELKCKSGY